MHCTEKTNGPKQRFHDLQIELIPVRRKKPAMIQELLVKVLARSTHEEHDCYKCEGTQAVNIKKITELPDRLLITTTRYTIIIAQLLASNSQVSFPPRYTSKGKEQKNSDMQLEEEISVAKTLFSLQAVVWLTPSGSLAVYVKTLKKV